MDNAVFRDPLTGRTVHVNDKTAKSVEATVDKMATQLSLNLGIDRDETPIGITFKNKENGRGTTDPTYIPQFHMDGKVYEIRATQDKNGKATGYEIYDVTNSKEGEKVDAEHVKQSDALKKAQKKAKAATNEAKKAVKAEESKIDPRDAIVSQIDAGNGNWYLTKLNITQEDWKKLQPEQKRNLVSVAENF